MIVETWHMSVCEVDSIVVDLKRRGSKVLVESRDMH